MGFSNLYNKIVKSEFAVQKNRLAPRKVYRIVSYQYVDGELKTFSGTKSAFVFLIGITPDKTLHCLKISEVQPTKFFNWLRLNLKKNLKNEDLIQKIDQSSLDEIIVPDTRVGTRYFQNIKTNTIYSQQPGTYRTYISKNIKAINEVVFDSDQVLKLMRIPKPPAKKENSPNS
jgi:hypothetical protein